MREKTRRIEKFVSELIKPAPGTFDTTAMAKGEPGLPSYFLWRGKSYVIKQILDKWKETSQCRTGAMEKYLHRHWYKIKTNSGEVLKIYFERQSLPRAQRKRRWYLYSIQE
jgi:hypothetical protein